LSNIKWKDELTNLIQKQIEEKEVGLVKLPDKLVGYLAEGITHDKFDVFSILSYFLPDHNKKFYLKHVIVEL